MSSFLNTGQLTFAVATKRRALLISPPNYRYFKRLALLDQLREGFRYLHDIM